jgi:site-specific recombinase XerD
MNLGTLIQAYILDCEYRELSKDTIRGIKATCKRLVEWTQAGGTNHRDFFHEMRQRGIHPNTERAHYNRLRVFYKFAVKEGYIDASPLDDLVPPKEQKDQIQPFTPQQISLLLSTSNAKYVSIMLFLLDTGIRVNELCDLTCGDVDLQERRCKIRGKGNKLRMVYFGTRVGRMISKRVITSDADTPLFASPSGGKMLRGTVSDRIRAIGQAAKIQGVRCSPHTFRHTFAIMFLRNGGNVFALKELMGHADLKTTMRYVAIAEADLADQHKRFSPADSLRKR